MARRKLRQIVLGVLGASLIACPARAANLLVDDDNIPCSTAKYHTINAALAAAEAGDEIDICAGTYPEQVVLTKPLVLNGEPIGSAKVVIQPPALPVSRPSVIGGKLVTAGILVDAPRVVLENLNVDLSHAVATGCAPVVTGVYARNASGAITNLDVGGAHATTTTDCDTGVGLLVEGGTAGAVFGQPVLGQAVLSIADSTFHDNQKGGVVVLGNRASVKIKDSGAFGTGPTATGAAQNGFELSSGVRGRLQNLDIRNFDTLVPGKTATGLLAFGAGKVRLRGATIQNVQTGVFVVGNGMRVLSSQLGDLQSDGIVFLGTKNRALGNNIDVSSVDGVFIDGQHNTVRGGVMKNMPIGVWFFAGDRNVAKGIDFIGNTVPQKEMTGGTRNLSATTADPFNLQCGAAADCDDGDPCTVDACDTTTGTCSYTSLPDSTSCADGTVCNGAEVCVQGKCKAGVPLVCVDGNECTQDVCDPVLGCQFPALPDGSPCAAGTCLAGVCQ